MKHGKTTNSHLGGAGNPINQTASIKKWNKFGRQRIETLNSDFEQYQNPRYEGPSLETRIEIETISNTDTLACK